MAVHILNKADNKMEIKSNVDILDPIIIKMKEMLGKLGFRESTVGGRTNYVSKNLYCIPQHIDPIGYFFEYAHSLEEAQKNWHGDGDGFPDDMGEDAILQGLEKELRKSMDS